MLPSHQVEEMMINGKQSGFIDIHSHFLPFLDDGAQNYDQCVAAARWYVSAGFEKVIATPHYIPGTKWEATPDQILSNIRQTENILKEHEIPLTILPGMEIILTESICRNFDPDQFLSLGEKGYYLIEFPLNSPLSTPVAEGLQRLQSTESIHFAIAHPERCKVFHDSNDLLKRFVTNGMLAQVNIDSLLGKAGPKVQQKALEYLQAGLVHFLASDTHARDGRMPPDKSTIEHLCGLLGEETTSNALKHNPQRLLAGKKVDPLISDGNINFIAEPYVPQGGYMQKLKKIFTRN